MNESIGCGVLTIIFAILIWLQFFGAWVFQMLWNFVMPLFNVITLDYWQAFGVWLLIGLVGGCFKAVTRKE